MKIKTTFRDFLAESTLAEDAKISALVQELARNYSSFTNFGAPATASMNFLEEKRSWTITAKNVKLEETVKIPAEFMLRVDRDAEEYKFDFFFTIGYKGVENFDNDNGNMFGNEERLGISLENLSLQRIEVTSASLNYNETKFSKDLGKTVLSFLLTILKPQFDMVGDEALIIRQL